MSVDYNANRPWRFVFPPVYRYLPSRYVDSFFANGELRLSSFAQFKKHKDEAGGDKEEGQASVSAQGGGRQFTASVIVGQQSYVLSTSFVLDRPVMEAFSGCDAAIEISNVPDFALAVARQLSGFVSGISGLCTYAGRVLVRKVADDPFPLPSDPKEGIPIERVFAAAAAAGQDEELF